MMNQALAHSGRRAVAVTQRRTMAGGPFPYKLNVNKNKFCEEWNGRREITERSFEANGKTVPAIILLAGLVPYGVYRACRAELEATGGRRYKDMV
mmetsp:Transcript_5681/g.10018  ORF Transcript_5681/g.10018 Transcript_5681/m.10018 type:complete len:95 (+) Transcript_5681:57-341(+)|eukprot:CAMPEP_0198287728 /NCGR_PEP_ID=MMETSP1449-20131203/6434_1 /TAXON_ID=420275 /ORGANISM="Attheya septentrionalis, Strain CCMP2084" /LENGTH=94 /DNA_ID=CAMNT_0043985719 /DNA_START=50 /DNA_END=334 /DNA_ORIENTATION=-